MFDITKIKIKKVQLISFKLETPPIYSETNKYKYVFDVTSNFRVNKSDKLIDIILDVKISICELEKVEQFFAGEIKTSNIYKIEEFEQLVKFEDGSLKVHDELISKLVSISVATTRGMLVIKATGSLLKNVYLPIINPEEFVKKSEYKLVKQ